MEAMLKLLASMVSIVGGTEAEQLAQAVTSIAVAYGRLALLRKEQAVLTAYLEEQSALDKELDERYTAYQQDLDAQAKVFMQLVEQAFSPDFQHMLMHSVRLARAAGIPEEELLNTVEQVDAFFLE